MKTAVKYFLLGTSLVAVSFVTDALAQPAAAPTTFAAPTVSPPAVLAKGPDLSVPLPVGKKDAKKDDGDDKTPESVKGVRRQLTESSDGITLDVLNNAREAIAKLDALIDIEKRLSDLEKIRQERDEANKATLAAAIPATALAPPPIYSPPPSMNASESRPAPVPFVPPPSPVDVVRIEGSNNRYAAVIKEGDSTRTIHAGDKLPDGSVVLSISKRGVELQRNNRDARLVQVKDVQTVFGNSH
ncbi:MAG: hypothetical protein AB7H77_05945 [Bdellovibrionales bacterium]